MTDLSVSSFPLIPCNMLHRNSIIAMLTAMGGGMYPGKSGLHDSMPAQLKHKRLLPHAEKHLSNGCDGWLYYTAWEKRSCALGHPCSLCTPCSIPSQCSWTRGVRTSTQCRGCDWSVHTYWFSVSLFYITQRLVRCFRYRGPSHSSHRLSQGPVSPVWLTTE